MPRLFTIKNTGFLLGPLAMVLVYLLLPLPPQGRGAAAMAVLMAVWWMTEAIPIAATALLPLLGASSLAKAAAPYAHPIVFLFLGGFLIAAATEKTGLHKRLALAVLSKVGKTPSRVVAGFMMVTAFISMWVSNTATVLMMLPIAQSVIGRLEKEEGSKDLSAALMLGVAYAASIGGIGTLIGTPPNALFAAFFQTHYGKTVSFLSWLTIGLPVMILLLPAAWVVLTRWVFRVGRSPFEEGPAYFRKELRALGPMSRPEQTVLVVFSLTALAWILRPFLGQSIPFLARVDDSWIAMAGALLLFLLPSDQRGRRILDWTVEHQIPWGVLILFGGGLSMATALESTGVTQFIGEKLQGLGGLPPLVLILLITTLMTFLSELTSNTAQAAAFLPVIAALADSLSFDPWRLLVPAILGVSLAFMMPAGTPPNAIVFASGRVTIRQMCRAGFILNWIGILLVILVSTLVFAI